MKEQNDFRTYLNLPYNFRNGPDRKDDPQVKEEGINCQILTHFVLEELTDHRLSADIRSKEIFDDDEQFIPIGTQDGLVHGDIFMFGRKNLKDPRKLHLAIFTGEEDNEGDPILIHATTVEQKVALWPMRQFQLYKRYEILYAVKRFCPKEGI